MPFLITEEDVERYDWDAADVGCWAYIVTGCFQFFATEEACRDSYRETLRC